MLIKFENFGDEVTINTKMIVFERQSGDKSRVYLTLSVGQTLELQTKTWRKIENLLKEKEELIDLDLKCD